ncbi:MAG TPA: hypothetical protein VIX12_09425, partial [Candidatus Binataceae bacterium]
MKTTILAATLITFGWLAVGNAGTHVTIKNGQDLEAARETAALRARNDHPLTQVVNNKDLKVDITADRIMRSCCMPPNLVVSGKVTNLGARPIDYVKLILSFEDKDGKIVHAENVYNMKAVSLGDDEQVQKILNEKPHFQPLMPGD